MLVQFRINILYFTGPHDRLNRGLNPVKKDIVNMLTNLRGNKKCNQQEQLFIITEELRADGHFIFYQPYIAEVSAFMYFRHGLQLCTLLITLFLTI